MGGGGGGGGGGLAMPSSSCVGYAYNDAWVEKGRFKRAQWKLA